MTNAEVHLWVQWMVRLVCGLTPFLAQAQCERNGLTVVQGPTGTFTVADERGNPVSSQSYAAAGGLTSDLVQVSLTVAPGLQKWGVLNRQGQLVLPLAYDEIYARGCTHLQARQGPATYLFDTHGKELLRDSVANVSFNVSPRFDRVMVHYYKPPPSKQPSRVKVVSLRDPRKVYYRGPGNTAGPLSYETYVGGRPIRHELPFLEVRQPYYPIPNSAGNRSNIRLLDWNGKMLFDSIYSVHYNQGLLFLTLSRFAIVTDTLLRPLPALSYRYQGVSRTGPGNRWFVVSEHGKTGVVDRTGRVILPLVYEGGLNYLGANDFLNYNHRTRAYTFVSLTRPPVSLGAYYVEGPLGGGDTTRTREPLRLKHQKTGERSWLDRTTGVITSAPR